VSGILNEAKYITPNIGDLPGALKARLGDSNKNLVGKNLFIVIALSIHLEYCRGCLECEL
jgi:cytoskeleton-associated protein 5